MKFLLVIFLFTPFFRWIRGSYLLRMYKVFICFYLMGWKPQNDKTLAANSVYPVSLNLVAFRGRVQGSTFTTIEVDGHHLFTSVAWDLAHEQLVIADASGVVQVWNTYTESVRDCDQTSTIVRHVSYIQLGDRGLPPLTDRSPTTETSIVSPFTNSPTFFWGRIAWNWCRFIFTVVRGLINPFTTALSPVSATKFLQREFEIGFCILQ